jgi:hypothetical protein
MKSWRYQVTAPCQWYCSTDVLFSQVHKWNFKIGGAGRGGEAGRPAAAEGRRGFRPGRLQVGKTAGEAAGSKANPPYVL